jgi:hypothetical protein
MKSGCPPNKSPSSERQLSSNPSVNSRGCEALNALLGAAYDRNSSNPDPKLGNFGQLINKSVSASVSMPTCVRVEIGFTDKVGDDSLAGGRLEQTLLNSVGSSLVVGEPLTPFGFWPSRV